MSKQQTVPAGSVGSEIELGDSIYKSFNEIKLDKNWEKIGNDDINPKIVKYNAKKQYSKLILRNFNNKNPEILLFRNNAKIKLSTKLLKFSNKDILR